MTSPSKEGSDPADNTLENSEGEAPNDSRRDRKPSFADSRVIAPVGSAPVGREPEAPNDQENAVLPSTENDGPEAEENQTDPEEDSEEDFQLVELSIPSKDMFPMPGLGTVTPLNTPPVNINEINPLASSLSTAGCSSGNTQRGARGMCYVNINYKVPFQFSVSWRLSFTNNHARRLMFLRLVCEGYFSHVVGLRGRTWVKQQYRAYVRGSNIPTHNQRAILLRRNLRAYFRHSLSERMALRKMSQSAHATEGNFPQTQFENALNRKVSEDPFRVLITLTDDGWKYLCPTCGSTFNSVLELRIHSCNFLKD